MSNKYSATFLERGGLEDENIDLFTGKINFTIPLATLDGISPQYQVVLNYRYNNSHKLLFQKWNRFWESGWLGVGWSISQPDKIFRMKLSSKQGFEHGTHLDEIIYWVRNGSFSQLMVEEITPGPGIQLHITYRLREDLSIKIIRHIYDGYYDGDGEWEIIYPTGDTYHFRPEEGLEDTENPSAEYLQTKQVLEEVKHLTGEVASASAEKEVFWEHPHGSSPHRYYSQFISVDGENQQQWIRAWNLTSIEDIYGNKTVFSYAQEIQPVGRGENNQTSTIYSYLYRVANANGDKLVINYLPKDRSEINKQHLISEEPNGYQERLQKLKIASVDLVSQGRILRKQLEEGQIKADTLYAKRVLSKIKTLEYGQTQTNFVQIEPDLAFTYYTEADGVDNNADNSSTELPFYKDGALFGALKTITDPLGCQTLYTYGEQELDVERNISFDENTGLSEIEHQSESNYLLVTGKNNSGEKELRIHYWTNDGWETQTLHTEPSSENPRSLFAPGRLVTSDDTIAFSANDRKVKIYELDKKTGAKWEQTITVDPPPNDDNSSMPSDIVPVLSLNENYLAIFYPRATIDENNGQRRQTIHILPRDHAKETWTDQPNRIYTSSTFPIYTPVDQVREYQIATRNRLVCVVQLTCAGGSDADETKYPLKIGYVFFNLDNDYTYYSYPGTTSITGSYLYDSGSNTYCNAGGYVKQEGFNSLTIMDNFIAINYTTIPKYNSGDLNYEFNFGQVLSYELEGRDDWKVSPHPIQEDINNRNFPQSGNSPRCYYVPNFSLVTDSQFLGCSYSIGIAQNISDGNPEYDDDERREYQHFQTVTFFYTYDGKEWKKTEYDGVDWHPLSRVNQSLTFYNVGLSRLQYMDKGVFAKTHQVKPNSHKDLDAKQKEFLVYKEDEERFLVKYLPTMPLEPEKPDKPKPPKIAVIFGWITFGLEIVSIALGIALIPVTGGASGVAAGVQITGKVAKGINKAIQIVDTVNQVVGAIGSVATAIVTNQMINNMMDSMGGVGVYSSGFKRFVVERNAILYRNNQGDFEITSDRLEAGTSGELTYHSFFAPEDDFIPFVIEIEDNQSILYFKILRNNKLLDRPIEVEKIPSNQQKMVVSGGSSNVILYNGCHEPQYEDDSRCSGTQPRSYKIFKFYDEALKGKIVDYVVSKTTTILDNEREFPTDYEYASAKALFGIGIGGFYKEVTVYPGGTDSGEYKKYYFYNGNEEDSELIEVENE
ncbi:MAG: hypothetical protein F6K37_20195 [Moorea sp. SIO4E2]|uniref:hypothetical protein n=1 Tax=Moorena sp. SIO4E2 TaxID=2607826 RepID=UPI0013BD8202|nr:hypothetical protein [Moorena sp. SIO4E2]NEQ08182.1 hypothetical protein [Moorena sp. SIO4E2]